MKAAILVDYTSATGLTSYSLGQTAQFMQALADFLENLARIVGTKDAKETWLHYEVMD